MFVILAELTGPITKQLLSGVCDVCACVKVCM